ncbi:hypothetical protein [Hufsiella ginkgonis]|uniref:PQQ-binding-like beta-propeller repeat protein n=1 Tax=Hufsiella ginkgonis TaxID=2695274 RepID=A0A7K1Y237_9SPHI|nr:hypothetical protein [Hufsiella ginkgonis]MXV17305.1 hypothetical protein [Hufsiella ginkgonis]
MKHTLCNFIRKAAAVSLVAILLTSLHSFGQATGYAAGRKLLLRDEGLSQLSYVDFADPAASWFVKVPAGRDLQLIGNGLFMIGTANGYEQYEIKTGKKVKEVTSFPNSVMARKLRNGNILIVGLNAMEKKGIVLAEVDDAGATKKLLNFPDYDYVRLVRETPAGTYLVTANKVVFESDASGKITWKADITGGPEHTNAWQALRMTNGRTVVSGGYAASFQVFGKDGRQLSVITGPADIHPNFFAGFQVLPNGNYVVANWQGHGPNFGASGNQVIEYSPDGKLVWSWKQDAAKFSSLQGVIVLDGLDPAKGYTEGKNGVLEPIKK